MVLARIVSISNSILILNILKRIGGRRSKRGQN
jgi:hypothetical protein